MKCSVWTITSIFILASVFSVSTDGTDDLNLNNKLSKQQKKTHFVRDSDEELVLSKSVESFSNFVPIVPTDTYISISSISPPNHFFSSEREMCLINDFQNSNRLFNSSTVYKTRTVLVFFDEGELVLSKDFEGSKPITNKSKTYVARNVLVLKQKGKSIPPIIPVTTTPNVPEKTSADISSKEQLYKSIFRENPVPKLPRRPSRFVH